MPQDITRNLGPSTSQSATYEAIGHAEDYSEILYNINPTSTPILSSLSVGDDVTSTDTTWMTKRLNPPKENAHKEYENYSYGKVGSLEGLSNYVQFFQNTGYVTDVQRKVRKIYRDSNGDDLSQAKTDALTEMANDIELRLISGKDKNIGTESVAPKMGGIPYFMQLDTIDCTVTTAGLVTTTSAHNLKTGDFVYFIATKAPGGVKVGAQFFVNVLSDTTFNIYDNIDDAIAGDTSVMVKPTDAGSGVQVVKNNVISLGGTASYTLDDIDDVMAMAANRGGTPTDAYMSMENKRRFSKLVSGLSTTRRLPKDRYGSDVADTYETDGGVITAHSHRMYNKNRIDILDMGYWELRWFERPHEVTGLAKDGTYEKFVVEGKLTLQASQPKASASIIDAARP